MNIQNLIRNWKTTSAGLTMIAGSIIHLVFKLLAHSSDEATWNITVIGIIGGMGLILAGDASASADAKQVETMQRQMAAVPEAIDTGNTEQLKKTVAENAEAPNAPQPLVQPNQTK